MDNEEKKEVKKSTSTKAKKTAKTNTTKTSAKKATNTKTVKAKETKTKKVEEPKKESTTKKAAATKTNTSRKVATPKQVTKKDIPPVKEEAPKEIKSDEVKVFAKATNNDNKEEKITKKELKEIRKKRYTIEAIIVAILLFITLILILNRTFLKTVYKTDVMEVTIPRFTYYVSDKDNTVTFVTLRKSANLEKYYNEYLEGFIFYSCANGEKTFYYNAGTNTLIEEIAVKKHFGIKTITVKYDTRSPEEVCGIY